MAVQSRLKRGSRQMQYLIEQYQLAHPDDGADVQPYEVSNWAYRKGLWKPKPIAPEEQLRRLICRSLRETYIEDPQGREVRASLPVLEEVMTPAGPKMLSRWFPIFEASAAVARASFSLRRRRALADVSQLHFDFLSWNDNNFKGETLEPQDYNFNADIAEMSQPTTIPEGPDEDDDGYSVDDEI
jgi:hypothetical protein